MRKELKQYENVTMLEVIAAAALGSIGGGLLAVVYLYRIGGL